MDSETCSFGQKCGFRDFFLSKLSKVRNSKSAIHNQLSKVRNSKSAIQSQKFKVSYPKSEISFGLRDFMTLGPETSRRSFSGSETSSPGSETSCLGSDPFRVQILFGFHMLKRYAILWFDLPWNMVRSHNEIVADQF